MLLEVGTELVLDYMPKVLFHNDGTVDKWSYGHTVIVASFTVHSIFYY